MMTSEEFEDWALSHIAALGLGDKAIGTVMAWEDAFSLLFNGGELHQATADMLSQADVPQFAGKQRGTIIAAVALARKKKQSREEQFVAKTFGCEICGTTGWAIVPHPGKDENDLVYAYLRSPSEDPTGLTRDLAVCCSCARGERTYAGRVEAGHRPFTLVSYTEQYPDWDVIKSERAAISEALRKAECESTDPVDVKRLIQELARRMKMPKKAALVPLTV